MFQRISAVVIVLSFGLGLGFDTTAGESPIDLIAELTVEDSIDTMADEDEDPTDTATEFTVTPRNFMVKPPKQNWKVKPNQKQPASKGKPTQSAAAHKSVPLSGGFGLPANTLETVQAESDAEKHHHAHRTNLMRKPRSSDFVTNLANDLFSQNTQKSRPLLFYTIAIFLVASLIVGIYHSRGLVSVVSILAYVGALSSMSLLIRNCYINHGFKYPMFLTATHFVFTALVGTSILSYRYTVHGEKINVPDSNVFLKRLLPVALAFALSLALANNGLLLTNAHFYEMAGSSQALVTAGVAILVGKNFDMRLMPALVLITLSMLTIAFGEVRLSFLGLLACVGAVVGRAIKSTLQHSLMGGSELRSMDPIEVAVWTSMTCSLLMLAWSLVTEGAEPMFEMFAWGPFQAVLYTCIGASILNIAALFVLRELGPVAQQIVGQMKGLLAIVGAMAAFGEHVAMMQIVGYGALLLGTFWYNRTDMAIKEEKKFGKLSKETDEATKIQNV